MRDLENHIFFPLLVAANLALSVNRRASIKFADGDVDLELSDGFAFGARDSEFISNEVGLKQCAKRNLAYTDHVFVLLSLVLHASLCNASDGRIVVEQNDF